MSRDIIKLKINHPQTGRPFTLKSFVCILTALLANLLVQHMGYPSRIFNKIIIHGHVGMY